MAKVEDGQIVAAILACRTNEEAAKNLGLSPSQLYQRMTSDSYKKLFKETIAAQLETVTGHLRSKLLEAISVLSEISENEGVPASTRIQAANSLISHYCTLSNAAKAARHAVEVDQDNFWDRFDIL